MVKDTVTADDLDKAIAELLDDYSADVRLKVYYATQKTLKKLVQITKKRAPKRSKEYKKRKPGTFAKHIKGVVEDNGVFGSKGIWYVGGGEYRLTHLLVHGHQLRQGGRTEGNDFLERSVDEAARGYLDELAKEIGSIDK